MDQTYGYVRVSTQEQNEARQLAAMQKFGVAQENIIVEKISGKDFHRPRYQRLVKALQPGDVLVVKSIDRLGRNYNEILEQWGAITKKQKAAIVVLDMPLLDRRPRPAACGSGRPAGICRTILRGCGGRGAGARSPCGRRRRPAAFRNPPSATPPSGRKWRWNRLGQGGAAAPRQKTGRQAAPPVDKPCAETYTIR